MFSSTIPPSLRLNITTPRTKDHSNQEKIPPRGHTLVEISASSNSVSVEGCRRENIKSIESYSQEDLFGSVILLSAAYPD